VWGIEIQSDPTLIGGKVKRPAAVTIRMWMAGYHVPHRWLRIWMPSPDRGDVASARFPNRVRASCIQCIRTIDANNSHGTTLWYEDGDRRDPEDAFEFRSNTSPLVRVNDGHEQRDCPWQIAPQLSNVLDRGFHFHVPGKGNDPGKPVHPLMWTTSPSHDPLRSPVLQVRTHPATLRYGLIEHGSGRIVPPG